MNLEQLREQLRSRSNPAIVDLWAPWCGPCRVTKPILESLAREYNGKVDLWTLNVDEHAQILSELRIFSIPTVLMTHRGEIIRTYRGAQSRENYRLMFEALANGVKVQPLSMSRFDRFLRLFAGSAIAAVGLMTSNWFLIPIGGVVAFLGIHDRCPIWRAITTFFSSKTP